MVDNLSLKIPQVRLFLGLSPLMQVYHGLHLKMLLVLVLLISQQFTSTFTGN